MKKTALVWDDQSDDVAAKDISRCWKTDTSSIDKNTICLYSCWGRHLCRKGTSQNPMFTILCVAKCVQSFEHRVWIHERYTSSRRSFIYMMWNPEIGWNVPCSCRNIDSTCYHCFPRECLYVIGQKLLWILLTAAVRISYWFRMNLNPPFVQRFPSMRYHETIRYIPFLTSLTE